MSRRLEISDDVLALAMKALRTAATADELRMAQAVVLPRVLGITDEATAELLGRSRATVIRLREEFKRNPSAEKRIKKSRGGRRFGYLTTEEEQAFLAPFLGEASRGGDLVVSEVKRAFEDMVGGEVAKTTIYRMLDRHGWRKRMPRRRGPGA